MGQRNSNAKLTATFTLRPISYHCNKCTYACHGRHSDLDAAFGAVNRFDLCIKVSGEKLYDKTSYFLILGFGTFSMSLNKNSLHSNKLDHRPRQAQVHLIPQFDFVPLANAEFPAIAETDGVGRIPRMPVAPSLFSSSPFLLAD